MGPVSLILRSKLIYYRLPVEFGNFGRGRIHKLGFDKDGKLHCIFLCNYINSLL